MTFFDPQPGEASERIKTDTYTIVEDCIIYGWYTCVGTPEDPDKYGCRYDYESQTCEWTLIDNGGGGSGGDGSSGGSGGLDPGEYSPEEPDCLTLLNPEGARAADRKVSGNYNPNPTDPSDPPPPPCDEEFPVIDTLIFDF